METNKNKLIKKLPLISATVLILCFFLPWAKLGLGVSTDNHSMNLFTIPFNISYTGYDMLGMTSEVRQLNDLPAFAQDIMIQGGASNWEIKQMQREMFMVPDIPWYTFLFYLIIFIPLFGIAILLLNFMEKRNATKITTLIAGGFSMLIFLIFLISHIGGSSINIREYAMLMGARPGEAPDITVQLMTTSIGFYLLFLASLGCIVSFFTSFKSDQ